MRRKISGLEVNVTRYAVGCGEGINYKSENMRKLSTHPLLVPYYMKGFYQSTNIGVL